MAAKYVIVVTVAICIWLAVVIASAIGWNPIEVSWDFTNTGAFGDSFGPLSATMSAAAAAGAILAWREQRREIGRLRQNDIDAKAELAISRDDQTFFNLLSLFRDVVSRTDIQRSSSDEKTGHDAFAYILSRISSRSATGVEQVYSAYYQRYVNDLGHYFRLLYNIISFIDKSALPDKYLYTKIVRSLLSDSELGLIALNCAYGEGQSKFTPLLEKYCLLNNISNSLKSTFALESLFSESAFKRVER